MIRRQTSAEIVREHGIDSQEEWLCVQLYHRWAEFVRAEGWNQERGGETPDDVVDALVLIRNWEQHGCP
jgi:hypothetical protein